MNAIAEMVRDDRKVSFLRYSDRELWYRTECGFEFPVPLSETGAAVFKASDHAILFLRHIRRHMDRIDEQRLIYAAGLTA
jgi:hypothetical protein